MARTMIRRFGMIAMLLAAFAAGHLSSVVTTPRANAQLPQIPGGLPGQSGGPLGAVVQLGSSITEMEQHVSGLQKNLETLKKVQSALGGK